MEEEGARTTRDMGGGNEEDEAAARAVAAAMPAGECARSTRPAAAFLDERRWSGTRVDDDSVTTGRELGRLAREEGSSLEGLRVAGRIE